MRRIGGGVLVAAKKAVGDAGKVALSPWLWGAIGLVSASAAVIAVAYVYKTSGGAALFAHETKRSKKKAKKMAKKMRALRPYWSAA